MDLLTLTQDLTFCLYSKTSQGGIFFKADSWRSLTQSSGEDGFFNGIAKTYWFEDHELRRVDELRQHDLVYDHFLRATVLTTLAARQHKDSPVLHLEDVVIPVFNNVAVTCDEFDTLLSNEEALQRTDLKWLKETNRYLSDPFCQLAYSYVSVLSVEHHKLSKGHISVLTALPKLKNSKKLADFFGKFLSFGEPERAQCYEHF